jgi:sec-independent protein translocase protein TatA
MYTILLWTPGVGEIVVIALIVLLLFGGKKIPELMKGLGSGVREFNSAKNSIKSEIEEGLKDSKPNKEDKKTESSETE